MMVEKLHFKLKNLLVNFIKELEFKVKWNFIMEKFTKVNFKIINFMIQMPNIFLLMKMVKIFTMELLSMVK